MSPERVKLKEELLKVLRTHYRYSRSTQHGFLLLIGDSLSRYQCLKDPILYNLGLCLLFAFNNFGSSAIFSAIQSESPED